MCKTGSITFNDKKEKMQEIQYSAETRCFKMHIRSEHLSIMKLLNR